MKNNQNKDKEILEAFDEEFVEMHFCIAPILYDMKFDDIDKIKSFISKALQQVREEERKNLIEMLGGDKKTPMIEKSKTPEEHLLKSVFGHDKIYSVEQVNAYNQALQDTIDYLKQSLNK